jgi:hypothetical protein
VVLNNCLKVNLLDKKDGKNIGDEIINILAEFSPDSLIDIDALIRFFGERSLYEVDIVIMIYTMLV